MLQSYMRSGGPLQSLQLGIDFLSWKTSTIGQVAIVVHSFVIKLVIVIDLEKADQFETVPPQLQSYYFQIHNTTHTQLLLYNLLQPFSSFGNTSRGLTLVVTNLFRLALVLFPSIHIIYT